MIRFKYKSMLIAICSQKPLCTFLITALLLVAINGHAQNVGIGTTGPLRKLSVAGSIMVDQNSNNVGTLDSAALVFGNAGTAGISSRQQGSDANNLTFWTGGVPYMHLSPLGHLGVGGSYNSAFRLWVRNGVTRLGGDAYIDDDLSAEGRAAIGGDIDPDYRLRVWNGNSRFGGDLYATGSAAFGSGIDSDFRLKVGGNSLLDGDLRATGKMSIGGNVDNYFRFRVYGGDSRFGGNVEITGDVTAANVDISNSLTIDGKGSVRSNGPSSLRIGFDQKDINVAIPANQAVAVVTNITDFSGDNDDVRVFVSQFVQGGAGSLNWPNIIVSISNVNAANNTCLIWLHNRSSAAGTLTGTLYLTTIAKN